MKFLLWLLSVFSVRSVVSFPKISHVALAATKEFGEFTTEPAEDTEFGKNQLFNNKIKLPLCALRASVVRLPRICAGRANFQL